MGNIFIVGAGHMGGAMALGLSKTNDLSTIRIVETNAATVAHYKRLGYTADSQLLNVHHHDIIIIAVPPQHFSALLKNNTALLNHRGLVISVMAGIRIKTLTEKLGNRHVIRAIPNTPSEVEEGLTFYCADESVSAEAITLADTIFCSIGLSIRLNNEKFLDPATALGGGGPAVIAYFANALQIFGERMGLGAESARLISIQLLLGTSRLMQLSQKPSLQLCHEVQTKGGTTEQAINVLSGGSFNSIILNALQAASDRSAELGNQVRDK